MRHVIFSLLASATALMLAAPAHAATVIGPPATASSCANFSFSGATELACAGGYTGNFNKGSALTGTGLTAIQALGYTGTGAYNELTNKIDLSGDTITFSNLMSQLTGLTIIGLHYGQAGDTGGQATSFFSFNAGSGTSTITVTGRTGANSLGLSNAVLYSTGAVPEPATWAMMLLGFGATGYSMRVSIRRRPRRCQVFFMNSDRRSSRRSSR